MKKQQLFVWKYDNNLKSGCNIQLERYIRDLLEMYIINHQIITETSNCGRNYVVSINFIVIAI